MIINIISTQLNRKHTLGPKKLLDNILKGLNKLNIDYVFNQPINEYQYNWIQDDKKAIIEAGFIGKAVLVGPNIAVLPKDLPLFRKKLPKGSIYIHPSKWSADVWKYLKYDETKLDFWPVGIDLDEFKAISRAKKEKILLYFKQRDISLLENAKNILNNLEYKYDVIHYGFYNENKYKKALQECKFGIWIGCSETQGIGLQEALATNLPLIVLDSTSFFETVFINSKKHFTYTFPTKLKEFKTTSIPYFDKRCGIKIENASELEEAIKTMQVNFESFKPREYMEENLSLEKSAKLFISFFKQMETKERKSYNYKNISKGLFYFGLLFQRWAWIWIWRKIIK